MQLDDSDRSKSSRVEVKAIVMATLLGKTTVSERTNFRLIPVPPVFHHSREEPRERAVRLYFDPRQSLSQHLAPSRHWSGRRKSRSRFSSREKIDDRVAGSNVVQPVRPLNGVFDDPLPF